MKGDVVILRFLLEEEPGGDWDDGSGWLSSLISLRADIADGDHRALYLAWLLCAEMGELDDDAVEPPVPPGLGRLTASLRAFADFLRIDGDLIAAAAERSLELDEAATAARLDRWIAGLPDADKTGLLLRLATGDGTHLRAELLSRYRREAKAPVAAGTIGTRRVAQLLAAAETRAAARRRSEAEQAARDRKRQEREVAERRAGHLDALAIREAEAWRDVDTLVEERVRTSYDKAVALLVDLRDLAVRDGRTAEAAARLRALSERHVRKSSFLARLEEAGLDSAHTRPEGV